LYITFIILKRCHYVADLTHFSTECRCFQRFFFRLYLNGGLSYTCLNCFHNSNFFTGSKFFRPSSTLSQRMLPLSIMIHQIWRHFFGAAIRAHVFSPNRIWVRKNGNVKFSWISLCDRYRYTNFERILKISSPNPISAHYAGISLKWKIKLNSEDHFERQKRTGKSDENIPRRVFSILKTEFSSSPLYIIVVQSFITLKG